MMTENSEEVEPRRPARADGQPGPQDDPKVFILSRELSEVHLLLDNLSADPDTTISILSAKEPPEGLPKDWIDQVCQISWPPKGSPEDKAQQAALLIKVKDYLNRLSKPASGATIAFTLLVTQEDDLPLPAKGETSRDLDMASTPSRSSLACTAYPDLIPKADKFRKASWRISAFLVVWLVLTCLLSWYVAFGNAALGELAAAQVRLDAAQKRVNDAEAGVSDDAGPPATDASAKPAAAAGAAPAAAPGKPRAAPRSEKRGTEPTPAIAAAAEPSVTPAIAPPAEAAPQASAYEVGYCNSWKLLATRKTENGETLPQFESVAQLQSCQALDESKASVARVKRRLARWLHPLTPNAGDANMQTPAAGKAGKLQVGEVRAVRRIEPDVSSTAAWFANIMGSAVLPVFYGILGAGAAIVRSLSRRIKASTLSPRDLNLSLQQLALGAVVGACIGLFIAQPSGDEATLIGPVALSGSAISFVAGFGVDAVFQALEALIARIFNVAPPARVDGTPVR